MTHPEDDISDPVVRRVRALREQTHLAPPPTLWVRIQSAVADEPAAHRVARRVWFTRAVAASVLLAAGFAGGRLSLRTGHTPATAEDIITSPAFAVQAASAQLVASIDRLAAHRDSATPEHRAEHREVALVALGAAIAASSIEYPTDVERLLIQSLAMRATSDPQQPRP